MSAAASGQRPRWRGSLLAAAASLLWLVHPAPGAASVSSRELVELTDISSLSVSPDGRFVVFRTERADIGRNSYILRWHSVDLATGDVRDIGSGGEPIYLDPGSVQPEKALWVNDGRSVVFRALIDGAVGLWRVDARGAGAVPLVVRDEDVEDYSLGPGDRTLIYTIGPSRDEIRRAEQREYDSGIFVDSSIDLDQPLFRGGSVNGRMASQRLVGYWYVRDGLLWRHPRQQRTYDLLTRTDSVLGPPQPVGPFKLPALGATKVHNAAGDVAEAAWDGTSGSLTLTRKNGRKLNCSDALCSTGRIAALQWRPGSSDLLATFMDRERRQSLYLWNGSSNRLRHLAGSDGLLSGGRRHMLPCTVSSAAAICVAASPGSPPRVERIDIESGVRTILFDPNAQLRARYRPRVDYMRWPISRDRSVAGVVLYPPGTAPERAPLYINYYACEGFLRGGEGDEWPTPGLLDAGFVVACLNAVPSGGPQDAVAEYRTGLEAVRAVVDDLSGKGMIDRSRVAMGGLSFGSEVTMWAAVQSRLLAAASISSMQFEPGNYWTSALPGSDRTAVIRKVWGLGAPEVTPDRWRLVSPALNAGRITAPILFQLPEQEARRIPQLYALLARAGTPTELYAFPDEAHIKVQPRHRLAVYERNLDWFRYWLQDYRDPATEKSEQYRRWDRLRERRRAPGRTSARTAATARARPAR